MSTKENVVSRTFADIYLEEHGWNLISYLHGLTKLCHEASREGGWWTDISTGEPQELTGELFGLKMSLIHSEISEALEAFRKDLKDDKIPHRAGVEVELADAIIRICDLAGKMNLDLGGAILEKLEYNSKRADHKVENRKEAGGKKF